MRERRGPAGVVSGIAENLAAAVRRRQRDRDPRVVLYDAAGNPRLLAPGARGHDALVDAAERMLALAPRGPGGPDDGGPAPRRPSESGA